MNQNFCFLFLIIVENHSLLEQLNTDAQTRALQLELENQRLRMLVDSLNRSPSFEITDPVSFFLPFLFFQLV